MKRHMNFRTERRVDQIPFLIPPPLLSPLLTPFLRLIITALMFLTWPKFLVMFIRGPWLSGLKKTAAVSSLSLITAESVLGLKKYWRRSCFPCGVRAKWWKRPYTDRPSFDPDEDLVGPWLCECGWDSDCSIWREESVSALTNLVWTSFEACFPTRGLPTWFHWGWTILLSRFEMPD